ncbi:hypothetical protein JOB18_010873 [Solea senegalensis]|uniref:Uncharacterized protein n=1 Tax=Solea senegalensis TaxID=28829 RepID=A0AAV6SKE3_SOLSE|nr:hypothetical protein JOB18_010873 [Solea senegalensis]
MRETKNGRGVSRLWTCCGLVFAYERHWISTVGEAVQLQINACDNGDVVCVTVSRTRVCVRIFFGVRTLQRRQIDLHAGRFTNTCSRRNSGSVSFRRATRTAVTSDAFLWWVIDNQSNALQHRTAFKSACLVTGTLSEDDTPPDKRRCRRPSGIYTLYARDVCAAAETARSEHMLCEEGNCHYTRDSSSSSSSSTSKQINIHGSKCKM